MGILSILRLFLPDREMSLHISVLSVKGRHSVPSRHLYTSNTLYMDVPSQKSRSQKSRSIVPIPLVPRLDSMQGSTLEQLER